MLLAESGAPLSVLIDKMHHYIMVSAQYFAFFFFLIASARQEAGAKHPAVKNQQFMMS